MLAAGAGVEVGWIGPGYLGDFNAIGRPGEGCVNRVDVADGTPAHLPVPAEPGAWELRYYMAAGERVLAVMPLTVTGKQDATVCRGGGGSRHGRGRLDRPADAGDFIATGLPRKGDVKRVDVSQGNPARLPVPAEPGAWELRYHMAAGEDVLALLPVPVTVTGK